MPQVGGQLRLVEHAIGVHPGRGIHLEPCRRGGECIPRYVDLGRDHRTLGALADHDHVVVIKRVGPRTIRLHHRRDGVAGGRVVVGRERELHETPRLAGAADRLIRAILVVLDHTTRADRIDRNDWGRGIHCHGKRAGVGNIPRVVTYLSSQRMVTISELSGDNRISAVVIVRDALRDQLGAVILEDQ